MFTLKPLPGGQTYTQVAQDIFAMSKRMMIFFYILRESLSMHRQSLLLQSTSILRQLMLTSNVFVLSFWCIWKLQCLLQNSIVNIYYNINLYKISKHKHFSIISRDNTTNIHKVKQKHIYTYMCVDVCQCIDSRMHVYESMCARNFPECRNEWKT